MAGAAAKRSRKGGQSEVWMTVPYRPERRLSRNSEMGSQRKELTREVMYPELPFLEFILVVWGEQANRNEHRQTYQSQPRVFKDLLVST